MLIYISYGIKFQIKAKAIFKIYIVNLAEKNKSILNERTSKL